MNLTWREIPPSTIFFGNIFSGFENLITTGKCNFKAFRSRINYA
jgi:hypothetical protein